MSDSAWPVFRGFAPGDLRMIFKFAADPTRLLRLVAYLGLVAIYTAGLYAPIPGLRRHASTPSLSENWWFLTFLDLALTGGALGRGAVFSLGVFGPLLFGPWVRPPKTIIVYMAKRVALLASGALLMTCGFRSRRLIEPGLRAFLLTYLFIAVGGFLIYLIDKYTIRLHGPQIRYLNLALVLALNFKAIFLALSQQKLYWVAVLLLSCIVFVSISSFLLVRSHIFIRVEKISEQPARPATLQIPAANEMLLDTLSLMLLSLYVSTAGAISIFFGWRTITSRNIPVFSLLALVALAAGWAIFLIINRFLDFLESAGTLGGAIGFSDARSYAMRMLNNFWVVPGLPAGRETEHFIKSKLAGKAHRSFLLFAAWFGSVLGLEFALARLKPAVVLFPFGSFVFISILVMLVANISAVFYHINSAVRRFYQLLRGETRLLAEMYPIGKPARHNRVSLDHDLQEYWDAERATDQLQDMMQWIKLAREAQFVNPKRSARTVRFRTAFTRLATRFGSAIVLSFVVTVVCLMLVPHMERKDMALTFLPTLLATVFAPEAVAALMHRSGKTAD